MPKKESFIVNRIKSVGFALRGALLLIKTESSIKIQIALGVGVSVLGYYYDISATEWMLQTLAIALVLGTEGMNTAVEKLCDFVHPDFDKKIGVIKDVSAGAVLLVSVMATMVGCIIYLPKVF